MKSNLAIKYSMFSILLISSITLIFIGIFVDQHSSLYEDQLKQEAYIYSDILESSIAENIIKLRVDKIRESIYYLRQNSLIDYIYVLRIDGIIISDGHYVESKTSQVPDDEFQYESMIAVDKTIQQNNKLLDVSSPIMLGNEKLGIIRIGFSKQKINEEISNFTLKATAIGFLFIIVGSFLTHLIIKKTSRPLTKLTYLTNEISQGRFEEKLIVDTNDELSTLADSFNTMSDHIEETTQSLVLAKNNAEKINELKSEFLAHMSHEIRTPINTMLNYSSLAEEDIDLTKNSECVAYFDVMKNAGKRIIRTIDLILNMSEIQKGSYTPSFTKFDITEILSQLFLEFTQKAISKNLDLMYNNNAEVTNIFADKYTITQIFQNLIDNAIKYTDSGYINLEVINKNENVVVLIKDSGTGISEEFQKKMFEAFRQEEQGYTRKYDGAGLGLALVAKYCELNKAIISVDSKKGEGTTFSVSLKL